MGAALKPEPPEVEEEAPWFVITSKSGKDYCGFRVNDKGTLELVSLHRESFISKADTRALAQYIIDNTEDDE